MPTKQGQMLCCDWLTCVKGCLTQRPRCEREILLPVASLGHRRLYRNVNSRPFFKCKSHSTQARVEASISLPPTPPTTVAFLSKTTSQKSTQRNNTKHLMHSSFSGYGGARWARRAETHKTFVDFIRETAATNTHSVINHCKIPL